MSPDDHLRPYLNPDLALPLGLRSEQPLVQCVKGCNPAYEELMQRSLTTDCNGCDSDLAFHNFTTTHCASPRCLDVKTDCVYHTWMRPKKPIKSQHIHALEIKCLSSYVVALSSIHPSGTLPKVDLETLFGLPTDSAKCQVQHMHATTWLGSLSLSWCAGVQFVRVGKDG